MNNKFLLEAIALDLKRVALGSYSNSSKMAERFLQEVLKRKKQLDYSSLPEALKEVLSRMEKELLSGNQARKADDSLMYSTLLLSFAKRL